LGISQSATVTHRRAAAVMPAFTRKRQPSTVGALSLGDLLVESPADLRRQRPRLARKAQPGTFAYTAAGDREGFAELLLELAEELRAEIPVGNG
jgi:hypothetical protein